MTTPLQLDAGIYLEDEQLLIPWLTPREALKKLGKPELQASQDCLALFWRERVVLGGLLCSFCTLQRAVGKPANGVWRAENLIFADFDRLPRPYGGLASVKEEYHDTLRHLSVHLGTPSWSGKDKYGYMNSDWIFSNFHVRLFTDDREGCALKIFHKSVSKLLPDERRIAAYQFDMFRRKQSDDRPPAT